VNSAGANEDMLADAINTETILFASIAESDGLPLELWAEALNLGGSPRVS
jgi:hypothetical protein